MAFTRHSTATFPGEARAYERHRIVRGLLAINCIYARAWHRTEIASPCPIPANGPAILICNHSAGIDPMLLQATCPRLITWMIAREYYELPGLQYAFKRLGYIPVNRGMRDSSSLKAALRALAAGKLLGIFPEGRIETSTALLPFQDGVAVMAARAGVMIYPAYLAGIQRNLSIVQSLFDRQETTVAYGDGLGDGSSLAPTTAELRAAMENLRSRTVANRLHRLSTGTLFSELA